MAKYNIKNPKAIACLILTSMGFPIIVVLFIMGGVFFNREQPKVLNYANSMCRIDSRSFKTYHCQSRAYQYFCYGPIWEVHYGENRTIFAVVGGGKRYDSYADALNKAYEYNIGSSYSCWYDTRDSSVAQWDKPNANVAVILFGCGGLSILLTGIFLFLTICLIKQEIRQNDYSSPYIKQ